MDYGAVKRTREEQKTLRNCQKKLKIDKKAKRRKARRTKPQARPNKS